MTFVSVIIPAYKAERYIEQTIRSALNQSHRDLEVIVVNDGSPDGLEAVVQRLLQEDDRLRYIKKENGGVASARNLGYQQAKGEYLAFLDADDVWLPDNISKKLEKFANDTEIGIVYSDTAIIDENSVPTGATMTGKEGWLLDELLLWTGCCITPPSGILVRRDVLERVGLFHLQLSNAADQELFFRIARHYKIGHVAQVLWQYRVHGNNMHSNIALMERDALRAYQCAKDNKLFKTNWFRRQCFSNMYLIVGASWWGDGKNKWKGLKYLIKAVFTYPPNIGKVLKRLFK